MVAPGGGTAIDIECDGRNRPPRLADAILVIPDNGGPTLRLELRATIQPLLVFDTDLASLETPPGQSVSRIVRLVGPAARQARPRVLDAGAAPSLTARVLAAADPRGPEIELVLAGPKVGFWSDRVVVLTGLDRPRELTLPYAALQYRYGVNRAFVVEGDHIVGHELKLGDRLGDRIEILGGVAAGDVVAMTDVDNLADGMKVSVKGPVE